MASQQYILYDLASKPPQKAWSPNPWKTRLNLNYKKIDYKTVWLDYPDIKPTLKPHFKEELELYTCPTLAFPNGEYVADSLKIAHALEKEHPEPSLHMDSPYVDKMQDILPQIMPKVSGIVASQVPKRILNEASHAYWRETREKRIGMTLEQAEAERCGLKVWQEAEPQFKQITGWLKENDGPFLMGSEPTFADFQWAGFLMFINRIGEDHYGNLKTVIGSDWDVHQRLLDAVKPWAERDDY